jgi:acyl-CoA synthetase
VEQWSVARPHADAYITTTRRMNWVQYHDRARALAGVLVELGFERGARVGVMVPDGPAVHVVMLGCELAGVTAVGIGTRAGSREIAHILGKTGAAGFVTPEQLAGVEAEAVFAAAQLDVPTLRVHVVVDEEGVAVSAPDATLTSEHLQGRPLGPDELFMLNSTSGTTGLPKCVRQFQNRWFYFHKLAAAAGDLDEHDVFMGLVAAPFGFGLWTAHFSPTVLGVPTVVMPRFSAIAALRMIEQERVTVLCAVSTQFVLLLNALEEAAADLSSLRCLFTGGEAVPYDRAKEFEDRCDAAVLQFFGSNETGALSRTTLADTQERRLRTAGRVIDAMHVRILDDEGNDVPPGEPGQPACRGPATSAGYLDDDAANSELYTRDGWMTTGDIAVVDDDGYLVVAGRKSDFIIRGGKNISAVAVEEQVLTHPKVALAAAVAMPDAVFGERVCVYAVLRSDAELTLEELCSHLAERRYSKETYPEYLVVVDALPASAGGKVAKSELRADIRRRIGAEGP